MKTNVIEQDESEKTSTKRKTWTEGFKTGRENIMWIVMNVRPAEWKGGGGVERGNNKAKTTREDVCQKCCVSAVHSSPTLQVRESESGKYRVPIKEGREEKEKEGRGGKTHAGSLSWPIETQ